MFALWVVKPHHVIPHLQFPNFPKSFNSAKIFSVQFSLFKFLTVWATHGSNDNQNKNGRLDRVDSFPLITQILSWCKSSVIQPTEQQELWLPWETTAAAVWWYGGEGAIMYSVCVLLATAAATTVSTPLPSPSLLIILVRVKSDHRFLDFFTFIYCLR